MIREFVGKWFGFDAEDEYVDRIIESLYKQLGGLRDEKNELAAEVTRQTAELAMVASESAERGREIDRLKAELSGAKSRNAALRDAAYVLENNIDGTIKASEIVTDLLVAARARIAQRGT